MGALLLRPNPVIRFGIEPPITRWLLRRPLAQIIVEGGRTGVGA